MEDSGNLESTDQEGFREEVAIHWVLRYWLGFGRKVKHVAGRGVCREGKLQGEWESLNFVAGDGLRCYSASRGAPTTPGCPE